MATKYAAFVDRSLDQPLLRFAAQNQRAGTEEEVAKIAEQAWVELPTVDKVDLSECVDKIIAAYPDYIDIGEISNSRDLKTLIEQLADLQVMVI